MGYYRVATGASVGLGYEHVSYFYFRAIYVARLPARRYILRLFFRMSMILFHYNVVPVPSPPPPPAFCEHFGEFIIYTEWLITFLPGVYDNKIYDKTNLDLFFIIKSIYNSPCFHISSFVSDHKTHK